MKNKDINSQEQNDYVKSLWKILNTPQTRAIVNDQRLLKLAEYEVARGFMNMKFSQEEVRRRFSYFKTRVLNGSQTIKELEDAVYSKYGVQEGDENNPASQKSSLSLSSSKGFCIDDMKVADIPENSPENH
jgi:hypothetical protein